MRRARPGWQWTLLTAPLSLPIPAPQHPSRYTPAPCPTPSLHAPCTLQSSKLHMVVMAGSERS